jgi:nucleoside-diphosphate-sugar epimerase
MLHKRRIALIGGCGFIGHNLALSLKALGADVTVIDSLGVNNLLTFASTTTGELNGKFYKRLLSSRLELLEEQGVHIVIEDARNYHALAKTIDQVNPDTIIHLAAVSHAGKSNKSPHTTFDHSLRTLENALDCARGKMLHFVYLSSSMVYGNFEGGLVTESSICDPIGIYGALKFAGEKIVTAYGQTFDLPYTIIRPSALYGERCVSRRVGQIFIENALADQGIRIHGNGEDRLDFTYIEDLVHGLTCVLQSEQSHGEIFNLTYGESRSIKDLFDLVSERFPGVSVTYLPKDKLTPDRGTLCIDKAKDLIGYNPQNPIEIGFQKYMEWYAAVWAKSGPDKPHLRAVS